MAVPTCPDSATDHLNNHVTWWYWVGHGALERKKSDLAPTRLQFKNWCCHRAGKGPGANESLAPICSSDK